MLKKFGLGIITLILMLAFAKYYYSPGDMNPDVFVDQNEAVTVKSQNRAVVASANNNIPVSPQSQYISKEEAAPIVERLTSSFMDTLVQRTADDNEVIKYQSKEELLDQFEKISTREAALPYVRFYFEERDQSLYIVPTETPPWFKVDEDFTIKDVAHDGFTIVQENTSDLYGEYSIEMRFTNADGSWKIEEVIHR
ncbi:hypothetical protein G4V62_04430 [Bacillaceae bacterium SIJ1]|uniref:hypothetical protein n=1 Tax=Litoribacterium kuwaitense TaxID=1398745 RepID=UPI0013EC065B|nr:hypothetical protein [Litoribacterium kuwaitense]NGP44232.1 hypothetical protein [Litoribacterium kuwaitense]